MKRFWVMCVVGLVGASALFGARETPSRLDVAVQPEGAMVFVDGTPRGAAPCSIFDLEPGTHFVHVAAPSYVPEDAFVKVGGGEYVQKGFSLTEEKGLVLVKTEPAGAEVTCSGVSLGTTPLLVTTLASGRTHVLELSLNGYQSKRIDVKTEGRRPLVREETLALDSGVVDCTTEPAGATVLVNGVERGVTPVKLANVPKGVATVAFRLAGYQDETRELRLAPGDSQTLAVRLKGLPAKLTVVSSPEQAKVFVDDDYQGKTPATIVSLKAGSHKVRIELAGHAPVTRDVSLGNGEAKTEEFRLESVLGRLEIVTVPAGAKVSVDGRAVGTTRSQGGDAVRSHILALEGVAAGEHAVQVHLDGYQDTSRTVVVKAKDTGRLFVKLSRIFVADTEVETIRGVHRGVLIDKDFLGNVTLEVSPGVQQTFRKEDIRKITSIAK
ncbi:MAG: PEGA domain-containing protein [Kiritimatiellia bacterium]